MTISKLSLRRVNNIDRQIEFFKNEISEIVDQEDGSKSLRFKSGHLSGRLRDFHEFYVDDKPLISIISENYWNGEATEDSEFFNTHIGCLGAFGKFWDDIYISILSFKRFRKDQIETLCEMYNSNYASSKNIRSEQKIKAEIAEEVTKDFLHYRCQDCGDSGCGGLTLDIKKLGENIIWTDNDKIQIVFNAREYEEVLRSYSKGRS